MLQEAPRSAIYDFDEEGVCACTVKVDCGNWTCTGQTQFRQKHPFVPGASRSIDRSSAYSQLFAALLCFFAGLRSREPPGLLEKEMPVPDRL